MIATVIPHNSITFTESTGRQMSNEQIQVIELNILQAKKMVELGDALERLIENRDFKAVIKDGYFAQEAIRLVHLKSDPAHQAADKQQSILDQMNSIGNLNQYFRTVEFKANGARKAIEADEDTISEILSEEQNNG
jgi:hypothetical protein